MCVTFPMGNCHALLNTSLFCKERSTRKLAQAMPLRERQASDWSLREGRQARKCLQCTLFPLLFPLRSITKTDPVPSKQLYFKPPIPLCQQIFAVFAAALAQRMVVWLGQHNHVFALTGRLGISPSPRYVWRSTPTWLRGASVADWSKATCTVCSL